MARKALLLTHRPDTAEMEELLYALGAEVVGTMLQKRAQPDPQLFFGRGKTEEARELVRATGADLVVVNGHLKPGQMFNLQQFFSDGPGRGRAAAASGAENVEVYDRTRLILEIFRERAQSQEARLQVELAQLTWEMPLVKEYIHLAKKGEHPGFLAGGEYEVNQYYDMMKKRMARIRRDLEKMRHERGVRRKHRRRGGFHLVSLAGYTNAGKSSLLRAMSTADARVENRYFSTLSTKTARAQSDRREILVTDTVGFIEDLPPWMVEAFHSTLEEIALADVILLVLDASDTVEEMSRRLRSSLRILWEYETHPSASAALELDSSSATAAPPLSRREASSVEVAPEETRWRDDASEFAAPRSDDASAHGVGDHGGSPHGTHGLGESDAKGAVGSQSASGANVADPSTDAHSGANSWANSGARPGADPRGARPRASHLLVPMRRGLAPILVALNKTDRVPPAQLDAKRRALESQGLLDPALTVAVSAQTRDGLAELYERLYDLIPDYDEYEVALPLSPDAEALIGWIHERADVLDLTRGNEVHLHFEAKRSLRREIVQRLAAVGGIALKEAARGSGVSGATPATDAERATRDVEP